MQQLLLCSTSERRRVVLGSSTSCFSLESTRKDLSKMRHERIRIEADSEG